MIKISIILNSSDSLNGGFMNLFNFFKKKSEEETFWEAVKERDFLKIAELGKFMLSKYPNSVSVFSPYMEALIKLGRKEEAIKEIISFSKKKINEEYYDVAIALLKKALRLDPFNVKVIELLSKAYEKKEFLYDAFEVLFNSFLLFVNSDKNVTPIKTLLEEFIKNYIYPLFYEKYGDILTEIGHFEEAVVNYILASNLYVTLDKPESALRALLKARKLKSSYNLDKQIIEVVSHIKSETSEIASLLSSLILKYGKKFDFIEFTISQFKENGNLSLLEKVVKNAKNLIIKSTYLALINHLKGEEENVMDYMEKLKAIDKDLYIKVNRFIMKNLKEGPVISLSSSEQDTELPEVEDILRVLDEALDLSNSTLQTLEDISLKGKSQNRVTQDIKRDIKRIKETTDTKRLLSMAEAFLGLGDYEKAEEMARRALESGEGTKAAVLVAESLRKLGKEREAISFLLDMLNSDFLPIEKAQLQVELGNIYESLGEKDRALHWYKLAQEVLNDENLKEKIENLERENV